LYFAIYVNEVPLPSGVGSTRAGKTLGKLCEILQASDEPRAAAKRE
jgi:D-alanyl-D-alanine carboxypeptidase/D-alanyl-D-alanine-endopeptidase (penicillin-binding protein 4)